MRNFIYLLSFAFIAFSCASPQAVRDSKKVIKGEWLLSSITYSESGNFNVTIFGDDSKDCFEGSSWRFIPNNNTGVYTIGSAGCRVGDRHFIFTIQEIDASTGYYDFLLKPTDERGRSETNHGFRVRLAYLSDDMMTWQQHLTVDGKPFTINMNFSKL